MNQAAGVTTDTSTRTVLRYAAVGMGLVAIAWAALSATVFFWDRQEQASRFDIETYHLRAASLASRLQLTLEDSRGRLLSFDSPDRSPDVELQLRARLAAQRVLIDELVALERERASSDLAPGLEALVVRFDRVASFAGSGRGAAERDLDLEQRALASLRLAVEQLRRLHTIEANRQVAEMAIDAGARNRAIGIIAVLFAATLIATGTRVLRQLRRTMDRENALRVSLERTQRNQQRAAKMEALGRLAGGVAHDFNNLLTVILAHAELMRGGLEPDSPLHRETEGIEQAVGQASSLTRQLLTFSREPWGEARRIDLNQLIRDMELLLRRLLGGRSNLVTMLSPDVATVRADPREIERVLVNLVSNASDAMPNGGTVTVVSETIEGKSEPGAISGTGSNGTGVVRLSVCDIGTGMDQEIQDRVFEPFFTTKSESEGTGLGLPTVHGIVGKAGGWVEIDSEPGVGTRIDIYLPCCEPDPQDGRTRDEFEPAMPSETILSPEAHRADAYLRGAARLGSSAATTGERGLRPAPQQPRV